MTDAPPEADRDDCEPVLLWWLGDRRFAVPLDAVVEVTPIAALTENPGANGPHLGYLDLRGAPLPVFDGFRLLGLDDSDVALSDRFVILQLGGERAALRVGGVEGIETACTEAEGTAAGPDGDRRSRVARLDRKEDAPLVQVLDPHALLASRP